MPWRTTPWTRHGLKIKTVPVDDSKACRGLSVIEDHQPGPRVPVFDDALEDDPDCLTPSRRTSSSSRMDAFGRRSSRGRTIAARTRARRPTACRPAAGCRECRCPSCPSRPWRSASPSPLVDPPRRDRGSSWAPDPGGRYAGPDVSGTIARSWYTVAMPASPGIARGNWNCTSYAVHGGIRSSGLLRALRTGS